MSKEKTPQIRFKGYTDDWEQRKVSEVTDRYDNLRIPVAASLRVAGTTPYYGANGIQDYVDGYTHDGEFILVAEDGANDLKNYPVKCVKGRIWVNNHAHVLQGKYDCADNQFLAYAISQADIESLLVGGGRAKLNAETLMGIDLLLPNKAEQIRIGKYLAQLDNLITLHQRELDSYKKFKNGMLQKMFPKNGGTVPEIRFPGFTDPWEQRKLGDVVERITRKNQDLKSTLPLTISAQYGLIDQNEFFDKRIASKDVSGYYLVRKGEFAYNKSTSADAPWGAIKRLDRYESGVLSTLYIVFRILDDSKTDSDYLVSYYDTDLWHKGVQAVAAEGARNHGLLNIAPADFFETTLTLPQDIEEQRLIGRYFKSLDNLITLHQREGKSLITL
ncbi:restriction endonuclease subunit S [Mobilibacterium timonense]|uniref:restriction endonuclease subunit S n=1 Tax=Mobilibacterium timonense TaxID=1871012 RepID=UPI0009862FF5|nr:restriction endonuclease subunit S [Mobilibacterium timonense]